MFGDRFSDVGVEWSGGSVKLPTDDVFQNPHGWCPHHVVTQFEQEDADNDNHYHTSQVRVRCRRWLFIIAS